MNEIGLYTKNVRTEATQHNNPVRQPSSQQNLSKMAPGLNKNLYQIMHSALQILDENVKLSNENTLLTTNGNKRHKINGKSTLVLMLPVHIIMFQRVLPEIYLNRNVSHKWQNITTTAEYFKTSLTRDNTENTELLTKCSVRK